MKRLVGVDAIDVLLLLLLLFELGEYLEHSDALKLIVQFSVLVDKLEHVGFDSSRFFFQVLVLENYVLIDVLDCLYQLH